MRPLSAIGLASVVGIAWAVATGCSSERDAFTRPPTAVGDEPLDAGAEDVPCAAQTVMAKRGEVDVVVIVDTSPSMDQEAKQVQESINAFASSIGALGVDYKVIVIGSKPEAIAAPGASICVPPPLGGAGCSDNPPTFYQIDRDIDGNNALDVALNTFDTNYGKWLRPTAHKVFIVITDEDSKPTTFTDFDTKLLARSPEQFGTAEKRNYTWNSVCGWKSGTPLLDPTACSTAVNNGAQYQRLSQLTSGIVSSVCEPASGVFNSIAKGLVTKLGCEFDFPTPKKPLNADPANVSVQYAPPGAATGTALTHVTDASKCDSFDDAWYYDNNEKPARILFCPKMCTTADLDAAGKLEIVVGCLPTPVK